MPVDLGTAGGAPHRQTLSGIIKELSKTPGASGLSVSGPEGLDYYCNLPEGLQEGDQPLLHPEIRYGYKIFPARKNTGIS